MIHPRTPLPYLQMSRLFGECYVSVGHAATRHLSDNTDRSVVALLLARLCVADWGVGGVLAAPVEPTRFGSINALARSLGRPFETVRRHVHALAAEELVSIGARGVAIRPDAAPRVIAFYTATHDLLIWLVERLAALSLLPPPRGGAATPRLDAIVATALDIDLLPFEIHRDTMGDWTSMALWSAIAVANVRHVTLDGTASARFATGYVPDEQRVPASLAMISRTLAIPYATVWRHAAALEKRGLLARRDRGWIVERLHYQVPGVAEGFATTAHYAVRRIGELIAAGLDPAGAPDLYLSGPPELAIFA